MEEGVREMWEGGKREDERKGVTKKD